MPGFDFEETARKAIGPKGKLTKPNVDPFPMRATIHKAIEAFSATRVSVEKAVLTLQDDYSKYKHTCQQYYDLVDGDHFGLDQNNAEDKKRIEAARLIMKKGLKHQMDLADSFNDMLAKLDKIMTDLHKLDSMKG